MADEYSDQHTILGNVVTMAGRPPKMSFTLAGMCLDDAMIPRNFVLEVTYCPRTLVLDPQTIRPYVESFRGRMIDFEDIAIQAAHDVRIATDASEAYARVSYKMFGYLDMAAFATALHPDIDSPLELPDDPA